VIGELAAGIERMPKGRRRVDFDQALVVEDFGRVLAFDVKAALLYGKLVVRRPPGRPPTVGDAQIAAVARFERMAVATRDVADFEPLGVPAIDPWRDG
jgi:toxin FitB